MKRISKIHLEQGDNPVMPSYLKRYFWDIDFSKLDPDKYSTYVIERILDLGDVDAIKWLFDKYSKYEIKETVKNTRRLSKKSLNYWLIVLDLEPWRQQALARKQNAIWNY
ncbi:hypothetical protein COZ61_00930 [Candidatus Berkelbacteria bacterium CG_4_8_14_3_um_filter_33_6]|uniref:DUF6922 domain-containing protein n=1 Tax=Candidatus Berkelbacteria bacterium CG_4_10_14_0_2_um_filter_35_9_33_12 TaxID=1974499 RepID=A0A2M7W4Y7_9BACT|nr:MAG: hypothetical protein COZ61_00930 [Candidatus Berkelbacteria bacterium CG_4_8_14_3_um_filter_33_6]PJA21034.1 MAG: hypothetical protein COX60_00025 [Candidatus Berkelbacteria bacterium CG_4_10_14_0_2_um_filter_35_9_33_12]